MWTDAWKMGMTMWQTGVALQETMMATPVVIAHRSDKIDAAMRNPFNGDYGELAQMVPEKVEAFGRAGASLMEDWIGVQTAMMGQWRDIATLGTIAMKPSTTARIQARNRRIGKLLGGAGGKALKPVHSRVTANRKRLEKAVAKHTL